MRMSKLTKLAGVAALAASTLLTTTAQTQDGARDPLVFVHGLSGNSSNWDYMVHRFKSDGWTDAELNRRTYSSLSSNKTVAQDISVEVDRVLRATGAKKVDLVTHSMGGLSSRWFVKFLGGTNKVDDWVSIAGPNHGSTNAELCFTTMCVETRPNSSFLQQLNDGDETPGTPNYGTWWSPCDEWVNPDESTTLDGATNTRTACLEHNAILLSPTVYTQVRDFIR